MKRNFEKLNILPGYYTCACGTSHLSDFPFMEATCTECGSKITCTEVTKEQLDGLLYNLSIMAKAEPGKTWTKGSIAEFTHFFDASKMTLLMRFLQRKGYVQFKETSKTVSEILVFSTQVNILEEKWEK